MLRLVSDENVNGDLVAGLLRAQPDLDLVRVQDVGLMATPDPVILEWSARHGRVLITQDINTMVGHAWDRVRAGQPMPGVLVPKEDVSVGTIIEEILTVALCGTADDVKDRVIYLPQ